VRRAALVLVLALLVPPPLRAAPAKSEEEKAAMSLYNKGRARFDAGAWVAAEDFFAKSMAVYETPYARLYRAASLARMARCGDAMGLLESFPLERFAAKARDKAREMLTAVQERCVAPVAKAEVEKPAPEPIAPPVDREVPPPVAREVAAPAKEPLAPNVAAVEGPPAAVSPAPAPAALPVPVEPLEAAPAPKAEAARTAAPAARPIVVAPDGKGDYVRLEDALAQAPVGATLHLEAGLHRLSGPLVIRRPVRLVGDGRTATIVVGDGEGFVLRFEGAGPFVLQDLAVEHQGTRWARVVSVAGGEVDVRGIKVSGGVRNLSGRTGGEGLLLEGDTTGSVATSEFTGNALHGIKLSGRARPLLEGNACKANGQVGIAWFEDAGGTARGNSTAANGRYGLSVVDRARPKLEGNACGGDHRGGLYLEGDLPVPRDNRCERYVPQVP
jgi:hypothetical protein